MLEIKVTIEAPEIAGAINNLSKAIGLATTSQTGMMLGAVPANTTFADVNPKEKNIKDDINAVPGGSTTPQSNAEINAVPTAPTGTPTYTLDMIASAGAALVDAGKMDALCGLLEKYGVNVITALDASQYGAFAADLRALGAQI